MNVHNSGRKFADSFNGILIIRTHLNYLRYEILFSPVIPFWRFNCFSQKLDGNWKGSRETPNGNFEVTYTFKGQDSVLTGTWKTQFGESPIEKGKIDGKKFSFSISFNDNTINNTGEIISENEITIKSDRGEMKLTRVKL